jgi:hypothetical protein
MRLIRILTWIEKSLKIVVLFLFFGIGGVLIGQAQQDKPRVPARVLIRAGEFWDGLNPPLRNVNILIEDGRIARVFPLNASDTPADAHLFDFSSSVITPPGMGVYEVPGEVAGSDGISPDAELVDRADPAAAEFTKAARAGITIFQLVGDVQAPVSGLTVLCRPLNFWTNHRKTDSLVTLSLSPQARAIAPKRNVMESSWEIRKLLFDGRSREGRKSGCEDNTPHPASPQRLLKGEIAAQFQGSTLQDVVRAISIAEEFRIPLLLTGVLQFPETVLENSQIRVLMGPMKLGEKREFWKTYVSLQRRKIPVGILSSSSLPLPAALALALPEATFQGLTRLDLLRAYTSDPADLLKAKTIGSLEPGKSADFIVIEGPLFSPQARIENVFIEGREVFNREREP